MSFSQAQSRGRLLRFLVDNLGQEVEAGTAAAGSYIALNSDSELVLADALSPGPTVSYLDIKNTVDDGATNRTLLRLWNYRDDDADVNDFGPISIDFDIENLHGGAKTGTARITAVQCPIGSDHTSVLGEKSSGLIFSTMEDDTLAEAMRINAEGYLGIGTTDPPHALSVNGNLAMTGSLYRSAHEVGGFIGAYQNVVANNATATNPIYSLGHSYAPSSATSLGGSAYCTGYTHTNASFLTAYEASSWGLYVAADGDARVFLAASTDGCSYLPMLKKTEQPAFGVWDNDAQSLSNGSWEDIAFDQENFDVGGDFASDVFTAPVTGYYSLNVQVRLSSVDSSSSQYVWIRIVTSNRTYYSINAHDHDGGVGYHTPSLSVVADMDAGDTASVDIIFNIGTCTTQGSTAENYTAFQGYLLG